MLNVPSKMLIHQIEYSEFIETDRKSADHYDEPITVNHVRVDMSPVYARSGGETKQTANGVVYCYAEHTTPFLGFKARSQVIINKEVYTIVKAVILYHPFNNSIWGYELEVKKK